MLELEISPDEVCERFSQIYWHDSKLIDMHVLKRPGEQRFNLQLGINLIVSFSEGKIERIRHVATFRDCRVLRIDLDLLGVSTCGGDIASAVCYRDALKLEQGKRGKIQHFDLPRGDNSLKQYLGFVVQMIPPGGEIIVLARDFQLVPENSSPL